MSDVEKKPVQGKPWTTVGIFDSYETAANQVSHLIAAAPTYDYKIRRCGERGSQFKIVSRINKELEAASLKMEEKLAASRTKTKKKSKK